MEQSNTGTPDAHFDLISCLYHALEGAAVCEQYVEDAREQGDEELASLISEWHDVQRDFAEKAKTLLAQRLRGQGAGASGKSAGPSSGGGEKKKRGAKSDDQPRSAEPQAKGEVQRRPPPGGDVVDEASWESFPASDSPAY